MPVYEYRCERCETRFDRLTTIARADAEACPSCESTEVRRLLSVIGGLSGGASEPFMGCGGGGGHGCGGACACGAN